MAGIEVEAWVGTPPAGGGQEVAFSFGSIVFSLLFMVVQVNGYGLNVEGRTGRGRASGFLWGVNSGYLAAIH